MKKISIIVPTYNEEGNIEALFSEVGRYLKGREWEIIYIDDGSGDSSLANIQELSKQHANVKYISFSRNFGHQAALRAGLRYATGDAVISMDADLQHPPKLIPRLIEEWEAGRDIVYTIREDTKDTGLLKRVTSKNFYRLMNFMSGLNMDEGAADFRLLDRKVVDVINDQPESDLFLRGYISWIGFNQLGVPYVPAKRFSGKSKYTLKKMLTFASKGVTQFSIKPLRLSFILASLAFISSLAYLVYGLGVQFLGNGAVPGWLSLVALIVFLQGMQFLLLGLIGEYLGRTFMQTKYRPEFIVRDSNIGSDPKDR